MKDFSNYILLMVFVLLFSGCSNEKVEISEGEYQKRAHFVIKAGNATYWFDQAGGGFSRIIDQEGNDWISFKKEPLNEYPASAAAGYRGLPNLVYGGENSGAGHPGFDQCQTEKISSNSLETTTLDGKWKWQTTFYDDYAKLEVLTAPVDQSYWFLYEGTIAGDYEPEQHYWGYERSFGLENTSDHMIGERALGFFKWVYFGDYRLDRVLFLKKLPEDRISESLSYLGASREGIGSEDGMVVFGFGRAVEAEPLLTGAGSELYFGFYEDSVKNESAHESLKSFINSL